jgi:hypothetical protein
MSEGDSEDKKLAYECNKTVYKAVSGLECLWKSSAIS